MIIILKILLTLAVINTCFIGWIAINKTDIYENLIDKLNRSNRENYIEKSICWISCITVYVFSMASMKFSLSFIPYNIGKWIDGDYQPVSEVLAGISALFIAYIICYGIHICGMRNAEIRQKTNKLNSKIKYLEMIIASKENINIT